MSQEKVRKSGTFKCCCFFCRLFCVFFFSGYSSADQYLQARGKTANRKNIQCTCSLCCHFGECVCECVHVSHIFPFSPVMCANAILHLDKAFRRTLTPSSSLLVSCYCLCGQTQSFWYRDRKYRLDVNRSSFVKMAK